MSPCEAWKDLMLDYLYGLAEESDELRGHLATCAECQAELARARVEQGLLAEAAEVVRDVPLFRRPETMAESFTTTLPLSVPQTAAASPATRKKFPVRLKWAVAAA